MRSFAKAAENVKNHVLGRQSRGRKKHLTTLNQNCASSAGLVSMCVLSVLFRGDNAVINFTIDGKPVTAREGDTIFDVAKANDIFIKESNANIASIEIAELTIEKEEYDYSPEYGRKIKSVCLNANFTKTENIYEVNTYISKGSQNNEQSLNNCEK